MPYRQVQTPGSSLGPPVRLLKAPSTIGIRHLRQLYQNKWKRFQKKVTEELDGLVHPVAESAGMHLVPEGNFDALAVSRWLETRGFGSTPLSAHFIGTQVQMGLVMGFASASEQQIVECVAALKARLAVMRGGL